jgi:hypothetical protein
LTKQENTTSAIAATAGSEQANVSTSRRTLILGLVNASHVFNHLQSGMLSVLYPVMMVDLGLGYFAIGVLQTIYQLSAMGFHVVYGVLARFSRARFYSASAILFVVFSTWRRG